MTRPRASFRRRQWKKRCALTGTATAALLMLATTPGSAQAAAVVDVRSCSTNGASGSVSVAGKYDYDDAPAYAYYEEKKVHFSLKDTVTDGHHVRIRLLTKRAQALLAIRYWGWRANYDGAGSVKTWDTTAQDTVDGIYDVGVEVATFEGDRRLSSCTDWS